jgi:DnaJ-domain-containing protein 1
MSKNIADHYNTLGVSATASAEEVRSAYLAQVRLHPPDADPERFHEIHSAYQMLSDPLIQAAALIKMSETPNLEAIVADAEKSICRLPKLTLLALGDAE